ncbi:MAG: threonine--tRNA ligase, partial [Acidobacteria bacterium]
MPNLNIRIDGVSKEVPQGTSIEEFLKDQPENVRNQALAAKLNGRPVDLSYKLNESGELSFVLPGSADAYEVFRHSASHLMAHAVTELYPDTQVAIGPVIEDGFYYDFKRETPFTPEDLEKIENKMKEIASKNYKVSRIEFPK